MQSDDVHAEIMRLKPDWTAPYFGLRQAAAEIAWRAVEEVCKERDDYKAGAEAEAKAGDEAREENAKLRKACEDAGDALLAIILESENDTSLQTILVAIKKVAEQLHGN